MPAGNTRS